MSSSNITSDHIRNILTSSLIEPKKIKEIKDLIEK